MRELNGSYKIACLQCSVPDKEVAEYIQFKKRNTTSLPVKYAVSHVGLQADGTWVLGRNAYFSEDGEVIPLKRCKHVWIGDILEGNGSSVAADTQQCAIQFPISTEPLQHLLLALQQGMQHNFYPSVLTVAGTNISILKQVFF